MILPVNSIANVSSEFSVFPKLSSQNNTIAIVATADKIPNSHSYLNISSISHAISVFGNPSPSNNMISLISAILLNSSAPIIACAIPNSNPQSYINAFKLLSDNNSIFAFISDSTNPEVCLFLNSFVSIRQNSFAIFSSPQNSSQSALAFAYSLNSFRSLIAFPHIICPHSNLDISPALLACIISNKLHPAFTFNSFPLHSNGYSPSLNLDNSSISLLTNSGVSCFYSSLTSIILHLPVSASRISPGLPPNFSFVRIFDHVISNINSDVSAILPSISFNSFAKIFLKSFIAAKLLDLHSNNIISSSYSFDLDFSNQPPYSCYLDLRFSPYQHFDSLHLNLIFSLS